MPSRAADDADANSRPPLWPWLLFALAAAWSVLIRVPLMLNAPVHLDSDLAVDGLTLLDATRGHFRWHYPGTPFMGIGPVLLSLPQALIFGTNPQTLVSGGVVAAVGVMLATFLLAWGAFGPRVAAWSLVPLAFASTGAVWLSGRITGGHLVAAAFHAGAFGLLARCLQRGGWKNALALGLWCGLGFGLDPMFAVTIAGLIASACVYLVVSRDWRISLMGVVVFALGIVTGVAPRPLGARFEPYDAYREQLAFVSEPDLLRSHARLLAAECLPRLLFGHRLPGLETDPDPAAPAGQPTTRSRASSDPVAVGVVAVTSLLAVAAVSRLLQASMAASTPLEKAVASGLIVSALATLAGFVANRNIFNSDNYRYLVSLLVPWSIGFGLMMERWFRESKARKLSALACCFGFALLMTADLERWYARFGWLDDRGLPVRKGLDDPTLAWLAAHPEVTWIEGGYWDVYRLSFLTGGRVRGVPFGFYPNRFPEWRPARGSEAVTLVRPTREGGIVRDEQLRAGSRILNQARGVTILSRPRFEP
jgi:hypothetical protein